jgi:1,4-dihydroxy-2-naphthoate octaprenyltransferase
VISAIFAGIGVEMLFILIFFISEQFLCIWFVKFFAMLLSKKSARRFHHFFCTRDLHSGLCCVALSKLFFNVFFANVFAIIPFYNLFLRPPFRKRALKKACREWQAF